MAGTNLESLPDDILLEVLSHLSVQDILRFRQVSRQFHSLTYERNVWANAYRNSTIVRPPGPFPSQSAAYLERELKKSTKLHANWTSPSPQPVSQHTLNLGNSMVVEDMALVLGRYLLVSGVQELRCYDLDSLNCSDAGGVAARPISTYVRHETSITSIIILDTNLADCELVQKPQLSIVCALMFRNSASTSIDLLDLHISHNTARFELKNAVHLPGVFYVLGSLAGNFLLIDDGANSMVLHVPTCQLCHLPPSDHRSQLHVVCVITPTHLLAQSSGDQTILEAFLLPDEFPETQLRTKQSTVLTRSHIISQPFSFDEIVLISSHTTHRPLPSEAQDIPVIDSSDTTISMTFFAVVNKASNVCLVDIVLKSPAVGGSMTVSATGHISSQETIDLVPGTVQKGCSRMISWSTSGFSVYTVTVGQGCRSIVAREVQMGSEIVAWDGMTGRLCTFGPNRCITIRDFV